MTKLGQEIINFANDDVDCFAFHEIESEISQDHCLSSVDGPLDLVKYNKSERLTENHCANKTGKIQI